MPDGDPARPLPSDRVWPGRWALRGRPDLGHRG